MDGWAPSSHPVLPKKMSSSSSRGISWASVMRRPFFRDLRLAFDHLFHRLTLEAGLSCCSLELSANGWYSANPACARCLPCNCRVEHPIRAGDFWPTCPKQTVWELGKNIDFNACGHSGQLSPDEAREHKFCFNLQEESRRFFRWFIENRARTEVSIPKTMRLFIEAELDGYYEAGESEARPPSREFEHQVLAIFNLAEEMGSQKKSLDPSLPNPWLWPERVHPLLKLDAEKRKERIFDLLTGTFDEMCRRTKPPFAEEMQPGPVVPT